MTDTNTRVNAAGIDKEEFLRIGHALINRLADFYETIASRPVTTAETPKAIQEILGNRSLPVDGSSATALMERASQLLIEHSLLNGHPKFLGFVTSSPTQIGALADLLASAVNANVGANILSPMATAIEKQTVKWLAEFIGLSPAYGGLLVSGGNIANFTGFLAARTAKAPKTLKEEGLPGLSSNMVFYCSRATHTWIEKAAVLFGHGTKALRWISSNADNTMNTNELDRIIREDLASGYQPFLVCGNAGDVSTGAVDDLSTIAAICKQHNLWFHVDGAYGIPAATLPEHEPLFKGMHEADSIALDPHKWLYAPLEAGCILVKDHQHLLDTYSAHPAYYNFEGSDGVTTVNYYEYGFQNSRGFKALKVWLGLQQAGRAGYADLIREDIRLSEHMYDFAVAHPELEAVSQQLSIATFRYVPPKTAMSPDHGEAYLNALNERLLNELQQGGELFLSDAIVQGKYCLRACVVNYRTSMQDIDEVMEIVVREGRKVSELFMPGL